MENAKADRCSDRSHAMGRFEKTVFLKNYNSVPVRVLSCLFAHNR